MKKFLALVCIILLCFTGCSSPSFNWNEIFLKDMLPAPGSNKGEINFNTESEFMLSITGVSAAQYDEYKKACRDKGFVIESEETSIGYTAYNNDGYMLDLFYDDSLEELSIQLQEPAVLGELKWPTQGIAASFPVPKSTIGKIEWEDSDSFLIYVGEMSIEDYNAYVDECIHVGFNIDYDRGDTYYRADNPEGYHLSLEYEGFNTIFIRVDEPAEVISETGIPESSPTPSENEDSTVVYQSAQELDFEAMINEYRSNEIRAKEIYQDNRYEISAEIVSIEKAGLREAFIGYNVNMTVDLDDEEFSICANFSGDFKEDIMKLNTGDTLTFTGECVSPSLWYDCTIVKVN